MITNILLFRVYYKKVKHIIKKNFYNTYNPERNKKTAAIIFFNFIIRVIC